MEKFTATGAIGQFVLIGVSSLPIGFDVTADFPEFFVGCHVDRIIYRLSQSSE